MAVSGDCSTIVAGAFTDGDVPTDPGSGSGADGAAVSGRGTAYMFTREAGARLWRVQQKLLAPLPTEASSYCGYSVAPSHDGPRRWWTHETSTRRAAPRAPATGAWSHQGELLADQSYTTAPDNFGFAVSVDPAEDDRPEDSRGSVQVFERDPGTLA